MKRVSFITRDNYLVKNRGLHNLKACFEHDGWQVDNFDFGRMRSVYFLKQAVRFILKYKNEYNLYVIRDPLFVWMASYLRKDILARTLFLSKEMYEYQVPLNSLKRKVRHVLYRAMHHRALRKAPHVVFSNDLRRNYYISRLQGTLADRSAVFESYYFNDAESLEPSASLLSSIHNLRKRFKKIVCYAGSLQAGRNIDIFIEAFDKHVIYDPNYEVGLVIAGFDRDNYAQKLENKANIVFLGPLGFNEVHELYKNSDWGLMHYDSAILNTRYCAPLKLYEYIHFDLGLITNSDNEAMADKPDLIDYYYHDSDSLCEVLKNISTSDRKIHDKNEFDFTKNFHKVLSQFKII